MNKINQKLIRAGARGRFSWVSEKCEKPHDLDWVETKRTSGTFEIVKVRSKDFIVDIVEDNGNKRANVFCEMPSQKKTKVDEVGNCEMYYIYWTDNSFKQRSVDNRAGGFSYAFTREMIFDI